MANDGFDKRITPARPDLAAERLRGKVRAERFVEGRPATFQAGVANIRPRPDEQASLDTQAIFGERCVVYDLVQGWAWVQLVRDGYVGYVSSRDLSLGGWREATNRIAALRAPIFSKADLKSPSLGYLPLGAEVVVEEWREGYASLGEGRWLAAQHVGALDELALDWVGVAERILGAPYLWGGKTPDGLDCSGLVQIGLQASGLYCPRDTDMQEREIGEALPPGSKLRRGDLVFWKGHVGVMRNEVELLHANAHHMTVAVEPLADAVARIAAKGVHVSSIRRIKNAGA